MPPPAAHRILVKGSHGEDVKRLQRTINRRLEARDAEGRKVKIDGKLGSKTIKAFVYVLYLMGRSKSDYDLVTKRGRISINDQRFMYRPGARTDKERASGKKRLAKHRLAKKKAEAAKKAASGARMRIVREAEKAAANYRKNPGAYHYLAGGIANLIYLTPSPRNYRSDCSQFGGAVYHGAGLESPAYPLAHQWASTYSMVKSTKARVVDKAHRKPGMLGMYGTRSAPHHVEIWCGDKFIGHGSPPIDSLTPGEPDYYLDYDFLN